MGGGGLPGSDGKPAVARERDRNPQKAPGRLQGLFVRCMTIAKDRIFSEFQ